jgi:delta 1-pyrroline-5-carboxylate dehydrogenase
MQVNSVVNLLLVPPTSASFLKTVLSSRLPISQHNTVIFTIQNLYRALHLLLLNLTSTYSPIMRSNDTNGHAAHLEVIPLLIGGKPATASTPQQFPVYCFEQQKDVYLAESADRNAANLAADAAWTAFQSWKHVSVVQRRNLLIKYAALLREREDELVETQRLETSVSEQWARKNVSLAANLVDEIAACISSLKGEIPATETAGSLALALTVPIGPILTIAP